MKTKIGNKTTKAANNKVAREILDYLVKNDGTCEMFTVFKKDLHTDAHNLKLF